MEDKMKYIHIAGTNAKGSVSEYIYNILMAGGVSCGVYTSPHLFSPSERMRMNGKEISGADYEKYMEAAKGKDGEHLFRVWTRAALAWFEANLAEIAVIEAGIGGKKDSTNVVDAKIAVLTPISLDHMGILGESVEKIARDKCGIIKRGATVITYGQTKSVMKIIEAACNKMDAQLKVIGEYQAGKAGLDGQTFEYRGMKGLYISAVSPHQVENACAAIEAALAAGANEAAVRQGLQTAVLPARVQIAGSSLVVDGGHNPAAIAELKLALDRYYGDKKIVVLTAVMKDKDVKKIADGIKAFAGRVICTCVDRERGLPAFDYAKVFCGAEYCSDPKSALAYANMLNPDVLVVCGSFYLAGFVLKMQG